MKSKFWAAVAVGVAVIVIWWMFGRQAAPDPTTQITPAATDTSAAASPAPAVTPSSTGPASPAGEAGAGEPSRTTASPTEPASTGPVVELPVDEQAEVAAFATAPTASTPVASPAVNPTGETVKVATVHFEPEEGAVAANRADLVRLAKEAAREGAKIIVFPEMATSGYSFFSRAEIATVAETIPGPSTNALAAVADRYNAYIAFGMPRSSIRSGTCTSTLLCCSVRPARSRASTKSEIT